VSSALNARRGGQGLGPNHEPLAALVARHLREAIMEGSLRPGDRIRQESVARELGTSRIPVREALQQLQSEGLVTLTSHVGARVAKLDLAELDEIYLIRERLEPLAIAQSTPHFVQERQQDLRRLIEDMEVADGEVPTSWVETDREFHLLTYSAAPLPRLLRLIEELWNSTQQYRRAYTRLPATVQLAQAEHRLLLESIQRRDPEDAERLSLMHIRRTRITLDEHRELFDK
jgi:DNA-binding GntR family transcriptional regulator